MEPLLGVFDNTLLKKRPSYRLKVMEESQIRELSEKVSQLPNYNELLERAFTLMHTKNPDNDVRSKQISLPQLVVERKAKKTLFLNYKTICEHMNRSPEHLKQYICTEQNTESSIDASGALIISGRLQQAQLEKLVLHYVRNYVQCSVCGSTDTKLDKQNRLLFIVCNQCTAQRSVQQIKAGFVANTSKRRTRENKK